MPTPKAQKDWMALTPHDRATLIQARVQIDDALLAGAGETAAHLLESAQDHIRTVIRGQWWRTR